MQLMSLFNGKNKMWKHKNFINLQLYAPAPANITINWGSNIIKVVGKHLHAGSGEDITYTNGQAQIGSVNDGTDYIFEVTLNSGYVLDTITLSQNDPENIHGVLKSKSDTSFVITAGSGGIEQTITLTSKEVKIKTADRLKSIKTHIQEAYTAIGNKSATLPTNRNINNLKSTIESVTVGVDTSDATAVSSDILSGFIGYAKGEKITGSIAVYDGTVEDVVTSETWVLSPNYSGTSHDFTGLSFISNSETFSRIQITDDIGSGNKLYYDDKYIAYIQDDDYVNWQVGDAYKTLIFQTAPTGDLLTWLQANGTKQ